jgi:hypothetical protein
MTSFKQIWPQPTGCNVWAINHFSFCRHRFANLYEIHRVKINGHCASNYLRLQQQATARALNQSQCGPINRLGDSATRSGNASVATTTFLCCSCHYISNYSLVT